jgi:cobalt-zinc-cadmium efflux system protein
MGNRKDLTIALVITFGIFILELVGGLFSNSLALLSDSGHVLTDTLSLTLALLATVFAARPAGGKMTFGSYRFEILSALFNGSLLTLISLFIFYESYQRFFHPAPVQTGLMMGVAIIGLLGNIVSAAVLSSSSKDNLNVKGAYLHVLSDAGASVGVILGGAVMFFTGWTFIDPILGILIALLILKGAFDLVAQSVYILLESAPVAVEEVAEAIRAVKGVADLHDLHIWTISSGLNSLSAHVKIVDSETDRASEIIREINHGLKDKFQIAHSTIQTECESCPEGLFCRMERKEHHGHHH